MNNIDLEQLSDQELVEVLSTLEGLKDALEDKGSDNNEK